MSRLSTFPANETTHTINGCLVGALACLDQHRRRREGSSGQGRRGNLRHVSAAFSGPGSPWGGRGDDPDGSGGGAGRQLAGFERPCLGSGACRRRRPRNEVGVGPTAWACEAEGSMPCRLTLSVPPSSSPPVLPLPVQHLFRPREPVRAAQHARQHHPAHRAAADGCAADARWQPCVPLFTPPAACTPLRATSCSAHSRYHPPCAAYIVERFGKYSRTLTPGLHILIPVVCGAGRRRQAGHVRAGVPLNQADGTRRLVPGGASTARPHAGCSRPPQPTPHLLRLLPGGSHRIHPQPQGNHHPCAKPGDGGGGGWGWGGAGPSSPVGPAGCCSTCHQRLRWRLTAHTVHVGAC